MTEVESLIRVQWLDLLSFYMVHSLFVIMLLGELDIYPSRDEFLRAVKECLYGLPELLCDASFAIDADYLVRERVNEIKPETRYTMSLRLMLSKCMFNTPCVSHVALVISVCICIGLNCYCV